MPFGLSSAPSCFQKIMATIFTGIPGVVVYLDDIVVNGATSDQHDDRLAKVFDVLAHFDLRSPKFVTCDASNSAIGAVLSQLQGPVAFASRLLTTTEQKDSVGEREALACAWACERWNMYLYGRHFTLRTDHQALTALLATSGSGHKPLREVAGL